jgi:predicted RNA binding protein YcfA (HicA-like mRNA interferase family)
MPKLSPVSYKQLVKVFEAEGFRCVRTEGDHMVFTKPGVIRPVVIPKYANVPVFVIKNNLRTGGISRDRYFELLGHRVQPAPKLATPL